MPIRAGGCWTVKYIAAVAACALAWPLINTSSVSAADAAPAASVRGLVRAEINATISSELVAEVETLPFKPGQAFHQGDVLLTFDCRRYDAELRAAEAETQMNEIQVENNRQLLSLKAAGTNDLALAKAKLAHAKAAADSLRVRTSQCVITAPFDGRLVERMVDEHEMPQANAPLLKIVKAGVLELDLIVPSNWAVWLKPDLEFTFDVDETGTRHRAKILNTAAMVDPISRTMKIQALLVDPGPLVLPGMSGAAMLSPPHSSFAPTSVSAPAAAPKTDPTMAAPAAVNQNAERK